MIGVVWAAAAAALAGEGMWLPEQMPGLQPDLDALGFEIRGEALNDPLSAPLTSIAGLGFCSASFVSPDGLVASNLHCIEGFVALNSTGERNWLDEGFTAASRDAELPAGPSARLYVLESIEDVTERIRGAVFAPGVTDAERVKILDRTRSELIAACEKGGGRRCRVASFDGGSSYRLIRNLEIRDLRVVHSPSDRLGYFGGDLDNFEWPRHDADYGLIRAYVGKNGKPAAPSPKNVPYRPKTFLKIDPTGAQEGEPAMVIGYPGGTERLLLAEELRFTYEVAHPRRLEVLRRIEAIVAEERARSEEADRHLQAGANDVANARKYTQGIQDNVGGSTVLADKAALAAKVDAHLAADPAKKAAIDELRALIATEHAEFPQRAALGDLFQASDLSAAFTAWRWASEREKKKDLEREPGLQDRDRERIEAWYREMDESTWRPAERRVFAEALDRYLALPAELRVPALDAWIAQRGGAEGTVAALFDAPVTPPEQRVARLSERQAALRTSTDPWLSLAVTLDDAVLAARREEDKARRGAELRLRPVWVEAVREVSGGRAYPDANSTLRITFGRVTGYPVRDGLVATPRTRLAGMVEKDLRPEYEAPPGFLEKIAASGSSKYVDPELGDVPVNFLTDLDTTGGNSGSATLNAKGELIGLLFDGNYESMAADWQFDARTTRSIHVDVRYIGWLLSHEPDGAWILQELGL